MKAAMAQAVCGGALLGSAAALLWVARRRIAGISGIVQGLLRNQPKERYWRLGFVLGLFVGALALHAFTPPPSSMHVSPGVTFGAGLAVGAGAYLANGCTSGHGICGLGRLAPRSFVAIALFVAFGWMGARTALLWGVS